MLRLATAVLAGLILVGCGQAPKIPEAVSQTPVAAATITVHQTGNAAVVVDQRSVRFTLDAAGALVVTATLTSNLPTPQTIVIRATIYDIANTPIGDATGGSINVAPGTSTAITLNGPTPKGTIVAATFEVTAMASPTAGPT